MSVRRLLGAAVAARRAPTARPCKYDGEPIVYNPCEDVTTPKGRHRYGRHDGPCGRKLVLLRIDRP
jgi:hypothetical protein